MTKIETIQIDGTCQVIIENDDKYLRFDMEDRGCFQLDFHEGTQKRLLETIAAKFGIGNIKDLNKKLGGAKVSLIIKR